MPVTPRDIPAGSDRPAPPPLVVAAALTGLEAFVLTGLGDWRWRMVFAINRPLGGIALALLFLKVPADRPEAALAEQRPDRR